MCIIEKFTNQHHVPLRKQLAAPREYNNMYAEGAKFQGCLEALKKLWEGNQQG